MVTVARRWQSMFAHPQACAPVRLCGRDWLLLEWVSPGLRSGDDIGEKAPDCSSSRAVVERHAVDFIFRAQDHADALVQVGRLYLQDALPAVAGGAAGLLDQPA